MKKLLGILGTITITGSGMTGIIGNAPTPIKSEINHLQTNNLENLKRNKRSPQYNPITEQGVEQQPQWGQPTYQQPQWGQPTYQQPQWGQPTYQQPQWGQQPYQQPTYQQPTYQQAQLSSKLAPAPPVNQQQWRPAECFYNPIDYNRTIRYNNNGTWEYEHTTQNESNCLWQKAIREANFKAQQKIQKWNNYFEQQRIHQQQYNYNQQVKREWEKNQLLILRENLIQAEKEGATLTYDLKSAFKMHAPKVIGAGAGALTGATIGLVCGPGAPFCSAVGSVIGAIVGAISGSVASEIINRI